MASVCLNCRHCGVNFERPFNKRHQQFCSKACSNKAKGPSFQLIPGGIKQHPLYWTWLGMQQRCKSATHASFPNYGGRGITVDPRWDDILIFIADMGERPEGCTLDRIDNDANYGPDNCRWATAVEQQNNQRGNVLITHEGITRTAEQWNQALGFPSGIIHNRLRHGWSVEDALSRPVRHRPQQALPSGG